MVDQRRRVQLGVIEFHSDNLNPGLRQRFNHVVNDLCESASIVDLWLMDIASVLKEFGYEMEVYESLDRARARELARKTKGGRGCVSE